MQRLSLEAHASAFARLCWKASMRTTRPLMLAAVADCDVWASHGTVRSPSVNGSSMHSGLGSKASNSTQATRSAKLLSSIFEDCKALFHLAGTSVLLHLLHGISGFILQRLCKRGPALAAFVSFASGLVGLCRDGSWSCEESHPLRCGAEAFFLISLSESLA